MKIDQDLIRGENFIIFGEDFARHPHALEHLMRPLFPFNKIIWVETIGLRSPKFNLYDLKRIVDKVFQWFFKPKEERIVVPQNVIIVSPFMIPFTQFQIVRRFNKYQVRKQVSEVLRTNNITKPITIASVLNACDFIGLFNEKLKVYFCVDEFSLWPGLDKQLVSRFENKIIQNSDLIIVTSETLSHAKTHDGIIPPVITHGVEFEHFNIGIKTQITSPFKICYFGLFDERSNQDILQAIAEQVANCEIHIFGNVICSLKTLKEKENIKFHGVVPYAELPKAVGEMDLFVLPYYKNELTNFINPLKLKEYLSTGRPVVASDLPEVVKLKDYLYVGKNSQEFVELINSIKDHKTIFNSEKVIEYIKKNETWVAKTKILCDLINKNVKK